MNTVLAIFILAAILLLFVCAMTDKKDQDDDGKETFRRWGPWGWGRPWGWRRRRRYWW